MTTPTPAWQPPPSTTPPGRPLKGGFTILAITTQISLAVVICISAGVLMLSLQGLQLVDAIEAGADVVEEAEELDARLILLTRLYGGFFALTGALFMSWMFTLRRSDRVAPEAMAHRPGWAIGGWFVPFLNLIRPYEQMDSMWRSMARPPVPRRAPDQPPVPVVVPAWWVAFLLLTVGARLVPLLLRGLSGDLNRARTAFQSEIAIDVVGIIAGVLAIAVVRMYTARARVTSSIVPAFTTPPGTSEPGYTPQPGGTLPDSQAGRWNSNLEYPGAGEPPAGLDTREP